MLIIISGCATTIATAAIATDAKSVTMAGRRREISTPVKTGTSNNHAEILYVSLNACSITNVSVAEAGEAVKLTTENTINAMSREGIVVTIIYLICLNKGTSAVDEANTVVSLIIDTLSPKYAPEIIAPAIQPSLKPNARPIPISATPMVAIVVHDEPVSNEITAQMMHDAGRKIEGWRIFRP